MFEIHSHPVLQKYKSHLCSRASVFQFLVLVFTFLFPLLIAYVSKGMLWQLCFRVVVNMFWCWRWWRTLFMFGILLELNSNKGHTNNIYLIYMIWYYMYIMILYYMIWYDMNDMIYNMIWYDMILYIYIHVYNVLFKMIKSMKYIVIIKIFSQKVTSLSLTVNI